MSTNDIIVFIKGHCASGALRPVSPLIATDPIIRQLCVSPEIGAMLEGPWKDVRQEVEWSTVKAVLDNFVSGRLLSLPKSNKHKSTHQMARLKPIKNGLWELRATTPKPGVRIIGYFVEKDFFVALSWDDRLFLGSFGSRPWRDVILTCQTKWRNLFSNYQPLKESNYDDYLTNIIVN